MRKIGMVLAALLALATVLSGCADRAKNQPKKHETEEAAPMVPLLTQSKVEIPSEKIDPSSTTSAVTSSSVTATNRPVTTTPKTTTRKASSTAPATTTAPKDAVELPDHNWT